MNSVESIISEVIEPKAIEVDRYGVYPRASMDALGKAGGHPVVVVGRDVEGELTYGGRVGSGRLSCGLLGGGLSGGV